MDLLSQYDDDDDDDNDGDTKDDDCYNVGAQIASSSHAPSDEPLGKQDREAEQTRKRQEIDRFPGTKRVRQEAPRAFLRSVPHVRGNWSGHVSMPIPKNHLLYRVARNIFQRITSLQRQQNVAPFLSHAALHISLSRPFYLQESSIESFVSDVRCRHCLYQATATASIQRQGLVVGFASGLIDASPLVLQNEERTRSFVCLPVLVGRLPILRLVQSVVNPVLLKYGHEDYHGTNAIPHVSVASCTSPLAQVEMWLDAARKEDEEDDSDEEGYSAIDRGGQSRIKDDKPRCRNTTCTSGGKTQLLQLHSNNDATSSSVSTRDVQDDDDDAVEDDDFPEIVHVTLREIQCTFGGKDGKTFVVPL